MAGQKRSKKKDPSRVRYHMENHKDINAKRRAKRHAKLLEKHTSKNLVVPHGAGRTKRREKWLAERAGLSDPPTFAEWTNMQWAS